MKSVKREAERRQHGTDRTTDSEVRGQGGGKGEAAARVWRRQPPAVGEPAAPAADRRYHRASAPSGGTDALDEPEDDGNGDFWELKHEVRTRYRMLLLHTHTRCLHVIV